MSAETDRRWDLTESIKQLREFRDERDWSRFHNPKDLTAALAIEVAELQELFLWKSADESSDAKTDQVQRARIEDELADVLIYALYLADRVGTNLREAVAAKVSRNAARFPAPRSDGEGAATHDSGN